MSYQNTSAAARPRDQRLPAVSQLGEHNNLSTKFSDKVRQVRSGQLLSRVRLLATPFQNLQASASLSLLPSAANLDQRESIYDSLLPFLFLAKTLFRCSARNIRPLYKTTVFS